MRTSRNKGRADSGVGSCAFPSWPRVRVSRKWRELSRETARVGLPVLAPRARVKEEKHFSLVRVRGKIKGCIRALRGSGDKVSKKRHAAAHREQHHRRVRRAAAAGLTARIVTIAARHRFSPGRRLRSSPAPRADVR